MLLPNPPQLSRFSRCCFVVGGGLAVLGLSPLTGLWVFAFGVLVASVGALPHVVAAEERNHARLLALEPQPEPDVALDGTDSASAPGDGELAALLARLRPLPELPAAVPSPRRRASWVLTDFRLPATVGATTATVVGEFNDWSPTATPMQREGDEFVARIPLEAGRRYRYRFLLDGARWENDWAAHAYVPNGYGTDDSVVEVPDAVADGDTTIPNPCGGGPSTPDPTPVRDTASTMEVLR